MSPGALIWSIVGALVLAVLVAAGVQLRRALGEAGRIARRLDAYADLPVVQALRTAERDVQRLEAASRAADALAFRAALAIEQLRRTFAVLRLLRP